MAAAAMLGAGVAAVPAQAAEPILIDSETTSWSYLADNTDPSAGSADPLSWTKDSYDDAGWKDAEGSFGAKNGEATGMGGGYEIDTLLPQYIDNAAPPNVPTYFFRTSFDLSAEQLGSFELLQGTAAFDDAMVVYLNGKKVAGFEDSGITENLQYGGDNGADPNLETFYIEAADAREGANTLAIAVHQTSDSSSDIYFDLQSLVGVEEKPVAPYEPTVKPDRIVLTPTPTPQTSQAVTWRTLASVTEGELQIRPEGSTDVVIVPAETNEELNLGGWAYSTRTHSAVATELAPATAYEYRVGTGSDYSQWYEFTTASADAPFEFIYFGDAQTNLAEKWAPVVDQAYAEFPNAAGSVNAGDLINTSSNDTEWGEWFESMDGYSQTSNVIAAPGNHEYYGDSFLRMWKSTFAYPYNGPEAEPAADTTPAEQQRAAYEEQAAKAIQETAYFTDYQNVRFISLNGSAGESEDLMTPPDLPECSENCPDPEDIWLDMQARWLDAILKNNPMKWAVATFHQPVFSTAVGRDEPEIRDAWLPVFQSNDIDLVLMGHDHTYARGYVNEDATDTSGVTTGPVYAVSVSGPKYYEQTPADDNVWTRNGATQVTRAAYTSTFQGITVDDDTLHYRSVIADKGSGSTTFKDIGDTLDEFVITKTDDGTKRVTEVEPDETDPDLPVAPTESVYASDLEPVGSYNGWGPIELDRANGESEAGDGTVLSLNGVEYEKGIGVHATSEIQYYLDGKCTAFTADVGVDDSRTATASVQFAVIADGKQLMETSVLGPDSETVKLDVDIAGADFVNLLVTPNGTKTNDHANWANARFECGSDEPNDAEPTFTPEAPDQLELTNEHEVDLGTHRGPVKTGDNVTLTAPTAKSWYFIHVDLTPVGWVQAGDDSSLQFSWPEDSNRGPKTVSLIDADSSMVGWDRLVGEGR
ncbi:hypothetical protein GCM10027403_38120 [Arthrobacter tecti]